MMLHYGYISSWAEFFFDTRKRSGAREIVCARRKEGEVGERERGCQKVGKSRDKPLSFSLSLPNIAPSCARFLRALSHRLNERELLIPYSAPPKSSVQFERREFNYACSNERGPLFLSRILLRHSFAVSAEFPFIPSHLPQCLP